MDHLDAEKMEAVERYTLGDLSVSEVEEFERHFFDCPQCSEELRALTLFQENARAVFAEQVLAPIPPSVHAPQSATSWWRGFSPLFSRQWAAVAAALVVGIFAGYLSSSSRDGAQAVGEYPLYAQARGEETVVSPAAGSKFYTLYFDKTWEGEYSSYRAVVRDAASGTERMAVPIGLTATAAVTDSVHVLVPTHKLAPGKYVLVMFGVNADKETELARFPYTLQIK